MTPTAPPADAPLPDILADDLAVLFCGINPGLTAAAGGHHFAGRGNRFWRTLHRAGFTPHEIRPEDDRSILTWRCGLTTLVPRATARADQVDAHEFTAAAAAFEARIARHAPRIVAFLGKAACQALAGGRAIDWGPQRFAIAGRPAWVLPNPSGRNRAFTLDGLVGAYRALREAVAAG
jgi:mismatch-specific thymine-DNA glycosylase